MRIQVTAEDIRCGRQQEPSSCPIALAVKRCSGMESVEVSECDVEYGAGRIANLPWKARLFVGQFEDGEPVTPFEFDLDLPEVQR